MTAAATVMPRNTQGIWSNAKIFRRSERIRSNQRNRDGAENQTCKKSAPILCRAFSGAKPLKPGWLELRMRLRGGGRRRDDAYERGFSRNTPGHKEGGARSPGGLKSCHRKTRRGRRVPPAPLNSETAGSGLSSDLSAIGSATAEGLAKEGDPALQRIASSCHQVIGVGACLPVRQAQGPELVEGQAILTCLVTPSGRRQVPVSADRTEVRLAMALGAGEHRRIKGIALAAIPAFSRAHALAFLRSRTRHRILRSPLHGWVGTNRNSDSRDNSFLNKNCSVGLDLARTFRNSARGLASDRGR